MRRIASVSDVGDRWAMVHVVRHAACQGCSGCGLHEERGSFRVVDAVGVSIGDSVWVRIPANSFLRATMVVYGIPLLLGSVGLTLGHMGCEGLKHPWQDLGAFGGAFFFGAMAYLGLWFWQRRGGGTSMVPYIEGIAEEGQAEEGGGSSCTLVS